MQSSATSRTLYQVDGKWRHSETEVAPSVPGGRVMASPHSSGASSSAPAVHASQAANGPFMITLCRVEMTGAIEAPNAPHLQKFRFFSSRGRQRDGVERRFLHMGYFETLPEAQKWAVVM